MHRFDAEIQQDDDLLDNLGANASKMKKISEPRRKKDIAAIKKGYALYKSSKGNPYKMMASDLSTIKISRKMEKALAYYFKKPTQDIAFINTLRSSYTVKTCPMCGSFGCGTLDHFLPQAKHNLFAIYSLNLVPCCLCNSSKNDTLPDEANGKRFLHPYFDDCLRERLIKLQFHHIEEKTPTVTSHLLTPINDDNYEAIKFHFNTLVRAKLETHAVNCFTALRRCPGDFIPSLEENPPSKTHLRKIIERELRSYDNRTGSKNNWTSLVLFALLDDTLLAWLASKLCIKGRKANSPLVTTRPL